MNEIDLKNSLTVARTLAPSTRTSSLDGASLDTRDYQGNIMAVVDCGAATNGSSPTANFKLQDSANNSNWDDNTAALSAAFTEVTNAASLQTRNIDKRACRRYIRLVFTIGGSSTPTFPLSGHFVGQNRQI